jgi:hypothetical protein
LLPRLALALILPGAIWAAITAAFGVSTLSFICMGHLLGFSLIGLAYAELAQSWQRVNQQVRLTRLNSRWRVSADYFVWPQ